MFLSEIFTNEYLPFRIYTIVEFFLIGLYLRTIIKNTVVKKVIIYLIVAFLLFASVDFYWTKADSFDSIPTGVSCIVILFLCIFYLYEQVKDPENLFLYSSPNFWVVVALIIFFSGTFFLFIYSQNSLKGNAEFQHYFDLINSSFNLLKNLIFSIAFIIKPGKSSDNTLRKQNPAFPR